MSNVGAFDAFKCCEVFVFSVRALCALVMLLLLQAILAEVQIWKNLGRANGRLPGPLYSSNLQILKGLGLNTLAIWRAGRYIVHRV